MTSGAETAADEASALDALDWAAARARADALLAGTTRFRVPGGSPGVELAALDFGGDGPLVVREKTHPATPVTLDQALYEMELVGHDFYLFVDKESERPAVVYRRRGYDYGVISLDLGGEGAPE